ncbi:BTB/POZ protein [Gongronella butleri]|nr:BTB/POZ protein [Gongronella butleri]
MTGTNTNFIKSRNVPLDFTFESLDPNADNSLFYDLCEACKDGNLKKVDHLVNDYGAPVNDVDVWNCSALYWACLCGHYRVAEFLLQNGCNYDPDTSIGMRCFDNALNLDIRRLLMSYKSVNGINKNQPFASYLNELLQEHPFEDVRFTFGSGATWSFSAHRFMLAARSGYFKTLLQSDKWRDQPEILLDTLSVDKDTFSALLRFLYTGQLGDIEVHVLANLGAAALDMNMDGLERRCGNELAAGDTSRHSMRRKNNVRDLSILRHDMDLFVKRLLVCAAYVDPIGDGEWAVEKLYIEPTPDDAAAADEKSSNDTGEQQARFTDWLKNATNLEGPNALFADIAVYLTEEQLMFPCHKAVLCRSHYFKGFFQGAFADSATKTSKIQYDTITTLDLPVIHSDFPSDVFECVLKFLYTDHAAITSDLAYDVLLGADFLLIDRLKLLAADVLTGSKEPPVDIYLLLKVSQELNIDRMEYWCINYFAENFDRYIDEPKFQGLVRRPPRTIEVYDDIGKWSSRRTVRNVLTASR